MSLADQLCLQRPSSQVWLSALTHHTTVQQICTPTALTIQLSATEGALECTIPCNNRAHHTAAVTTHLPHMFTCHGLLGHHLLLLGRAGSTRRWLLGRRSGFCRATSGRWVVGLLSRRARAPYCCPLYHSSELRVCMSVRYRRDLVPRRNEAHAGRVRAKQGSGVIRTSASV
jgi:hypothetical protein